MGLKRIKTLFVSHTSHLGGAEIVLDRFLSHVSMFEPIVALPKGDLYNQLAANEINVIELKHLGKLNKSANPLWIFRFFRFFLGSLIELIKIIRKTQPDCIQSNSYYAVFYCLLPALITKRPLILHMHDFGESSWRQKLINKILLKRGVSHIIAVSDAVKQSLIDAEIPDKMITRIYNSISSGQTDKTNSDLEEKMKNFGSDFDLVIGVLGSIEERKGIISIIEALYRIKITGTRKVGCVIAGEARDPKQSKYKNKLLNTILSLGLEREILFVGHIDALKSYFQHIDIFVHYPLKPDPLPTVILESISRNCLAVVSDNGGNLECIQNGRWGISAKTNDPSHLAGILIDINRSQQNKLIDGFFSYFSHENKEKSHTTLYKKIILSEQNQGTN